jgi:phage tail sheath gpL-like
MGISFGFSVPTEPGVYVEVDGSVASSSGITKSKVLVLGLLNHAQAANKDLLKFIPSVASARTYYGVGSMIAREVEILKAAYPMAEVWAVGQDEDVAGQVATGKFTIVGTATQSGTLYCYIAGQLVKCAVVATETQNAIATNLGAAINLVTDLPVTAAVLTNEVTVTSRHKSTLANKIDLRMNYLGAQGGEVLPTGVTVTVTTMTGGLTEPDLDNSILAMLENEFDTIVNPYVIAAQLTDLKTEIGSRWGATRMVYGHICGSHVDTYLNLITFGGSTAQNDPHNTILPFYDSPTPPWEVAAALAAITAEKEMDADDAALAQGLTGHLIYGMKPPATGSDFTIAERNVLLTYGLATFTVSGGSCYLSRARTTYRTDSGGGVDYAYYDQRTCAILMRILRADRIAFARAFQGAVLVDDASRVGAGVKVCSPAIAKGWFAARYAEYERDGLVTDADGFIEDLVVEVNGSDPTRLDILYPPQISGWLAVTAIKAQFRLK